MKSLTTAVHTLAHPAVNVVDCLSSGLALRKLARDPRTSVGDREIFSRVADKMIESADLAMAKVVGVATFIPAAPVGHNSFFVIATGVRCACGLVFPGDLAHRRHLERMRAA